MANDETTLLLSLLDDCAAIIEDYLERQEDEIGSDESLEQEANALLDAISFVFAKYSYTPECSSIDPDRHLDNSSEYELVAPPNSSGLH